jgi:antitoxin component of MazEF toxin-antitoxin module
MLFNGKRYLISSLLLFCFVARGDSTNPTTISTGIYNVTPPTLTNSQVNPLQLDVNGNLKVTGTFTTTGSTINTTQGTVPWVDDITQFGNNPVVTGTGTSGLGIPRVTVSSDSFPSNQDVTVTSSVLPAGAATAANQTNGTQVTSINNFPATQPVSGTVAVSNFPATQNVDVIASVLPTNACQETGGNLAAILADLTNGTQITQVSNFPSSQTVNGTVAVSNFPAIQPISATSLPLPTGASTSANQSTIISNQTNGTQETQVTNFPSSQNVVVTSSALPTGAATSALQTTGNSSLSTIVTNTTGLATSANQTNGTQETQVTNFPASQMVNGTVTANAGTGTFTVGQSTASNLNATVVTTGGAEIATNSELTTVNTTLGSPFQAGGSIGNTAFGISGTLPAYASTPTFNLGTLNGAATAANQTAVIGSTLAGTLAANSILIGANYNAGAPTLTSGQQVALQVDVNGRLIDAPSYTGPGLPGTASSYAGQVAGQYNTTLPTLSSGQQVALQVDGSGRLITDPLIPFNGPDLPGTAATAAAQIAGQYNTTLPTLTSGQQVALQVDSSGRLITSPVLSTGAATAANQVTQETTLTAIQANQTNGTQETQVTTLPSIPTGTNSIGTVGLNAGSNNIGSITNVTGTISLPTGAATSANQTNGTQQTEINNGSNVVDVTAANAATTAAQPALVVGLSPNSSLPTGTNVMGALVANQSVNVAQIAGTATVTAGVSGLQAIGGNIASGSADSGNPVKVGTVYNSTQPAPSSGNRVDLQSNQFGDLSVVGRFKFKNITGNATTVVKSGSGTMRSICINNNSTGGTVTIYDNTAGSGTIIFTFSIGTPSGGLLSSTGSPGPFCASADIDLEFSTGLTIVTAGSTSNNVTAIYK